MITRKIGKLLRGKSTPGQIMLAAMLGSLIGFIPGFWQGPGLTVALLLVLIIFKANLGFAAIAGVLAKLVSLPLLPVSFAVGRGLLDGPAQPLFKWMINTPALALFGFEHYATTGGLITGAALGILIGLLTVGIVRAFRRRMATLEEGSERYKAYVSKWWVKLLTFIFIGGGRGKRSYRELLESRMKNPIRPIGVVLAVLLVGLLFLVNLFFAEPLVTAALQRGLERANGATVDLDSADLDLRAGRLFVSGLAMADPNALDTDILRAASLEADVSTSNLLRKRFAMDRVVISDASSGATRRTPGGLIGRRPRPAPEPKVPDEKTIDDYIKQAETWKERLAQAQRWLERISGPEQPTGEDAERRRRERIERQKRDIGMARIKASHLIEGVPTVVIYELIIDGVTIAGVKDEVFDLRGDRLSTQPWMMDEPATIAIASRSGRIDLDLDLGGRDEQTGGAPRLALSIKELSGDAVGNALAVGGEAPLRGGTVDLDLSGLLAPSNIDLALRSIVRNGTLSLPGAGAREVSEFTLPIGLRGPLSAPVVRLDDDALAQALIDAGASALASKVREKAGGEIDKAVEGAREKVGDQVGEKVGGAARDALGGLLGGKKKKDAEKDSSDKNEDSGGE